MTDYAFRDRYKLILELEKLELDYNETVRSIFKMDANKFNKWHHANWPASSMANMRGSNLVLMLKLKEIQLRGKGLLA